MINWRSFALFSYKTSSVVSMTQRAISICSTYLLLVNEFEKIRTICQKNDYPASFTDTRIGIGLSKYQETIKTKTPTLRVSGCDKRRVFIEVPYRGEQTQSLKKQLSRVTAEVRPDLDVLYVAKPERQCSRRLREHGAPTNTFDRHPGTEEEGEENDQDTASLTTKKKHHSRTSRRTKMEAQQQWSTRRFSRIRNKAGAVVSKLSSQKNEQQVTHTLIERTKNDNPDAVLSSLAEHEKNTGHHINWKNVRVL